MFGVTVSFVRGICVNYVFTYPYWEFNFTISGYAGKVPTHDFIIRQLWGPNAQTDNQILRVHMANIRRKIEHNPAQPQYICTEIGVGYRMADPD